MTHPTYNFRIVWLIFADRWWIKFPTYNFRIVWFLFADRSCITFDASNSTRLPNKKFHDIISSISYSGIKAWHLLSTNSFYIFEKSLTLSAIRQTWRGFFNISIRCISYLQKYFFPIPSIPVKCSLKAINFWLSSKLRCTLLIKFSQSFGESLSATYKISEQFVIVIIFFPFSIILLCLLWELNIYEKF